MTSGAPTPAKPARNGCSTWEELGTIASLGGLRDPFNFWDFYDVPTGAGPARDQRVDGFDISEVNARFGATGDPTIDPLSPPPPAPAYHPAFDRASPIGPDLWNLGAADGRVDGFDIGFVVNQFGHTCALTP